MAYISKEVLNMIKEKEIVEPRTIATWEIEEQNRIKTEKKVKKFENIQSKNFFS